MKVRDLIRQLEAAGGTWPEPVEAIDNSSTLAGLAPLQQRETRCRGAAGHAKCHT